MIQVLEPYFKSPTCFSELTSSAVWNCSALRYELYHYPWVFLKKSVQKYQKQTKTFLLQLYNAYVETQDQLHMEKLENKRINKYLDEIVQEVEAKAPILKRQREEFERSQKAVASLSAKLEQAMKVGVK